MWKLYCWLERQNVPWAVWHPLNRFVMGTPKVGFHRWAYRMLSGDAWCDLRQNVWVWWNRRPHGQRWK